MSGGLSISGPGVLEHGLPTGQLTYFDVETTAMPNVAVKDPEGDVLDVSVTEADGCFHVAYTPLLAGTHSVSVMVEGERVPGSPFLVKTLGEDMSPPDWAGDAVTATDDAVTATDDAPAAEVESLSAAEAVPIEPELPDAVCCPGEDVLPEVPDEPLTMPVDADTSELLAEEPVSIPLVASLPEVDDEIGKSVIHDEAGKVDMLEEVSRATDDEVARATDDSADSEGPGGTGSSSISNDFEFVGESDIMEDVAAPSLDDVMEDVAASSLDGAVTEPEIELHITEPEPAAEAEPDITTPVLDETPAVPEEIEAEPMQPEVCEDVSLESIDTEPDVSLTDAVPEGIPPVEVEVTEVAAAPDVAPEPLPEEPVGERAELEPEFEVISQSVLVEEEPMIPAVSDDVASEPPAAEPVVAPTKPDVIPSEPEYEIISTPIEEEPLVSKEVAPEPLAAEPVPATVEEVKPAPPSYVEEVPVRAEPEPVWAEPEPFREPLRELPRESPPMDIIGNNKVVKKFPSMQRVLGVGVFLVGFGAIAYALYLKANGDDAASL